MNPIRIGIDARMYGPQNAGIGRYIKNLIEELSKIAPHKPQIRFVLFLRKQDIAPLRKKYNRLFQYIEADIPHYSLAEQLILPFILYRSKCDLIHFPHFNIPLGYRRPFVATIHDLTKHFSRGKETTTRNTTLYYIKYLGYKIIFGNIIKRAKLIFVDSDYVKRDLIKHYQVKHEKIIVAYLGVDRELKAKGHLPKSKLVSNRKVTNQDILARYQISKPYLLYVGNIYPHKNIERLIGAIGTAKKTVINLSLVIVCARNVFRKRLQQKIRRLNAGKYIYLIDFVNDKDLAILYQQAMAFIFPSLSEGFGLPGLEAMACGCPVISSTATCLPEIYGDAALYFNPLKIDDIAQAIINLNKNAELRKSLIKKGYQQVKKYSWQKMAKKIIEGYREVLTPRIRNPKI